MKLTDVFERIYVINLPYTPDRRERVERHLAETGLADPGEVVWQTGVSGDWVGAPNWWGAGNGAWGCLLSHLQVVLDAAMNEVENYLVLEDDVVFQPDASARLAGFMRRVPEDWGQIYLGGQFLHRDPVRVNRDVWRPYNVNRTHAFALRREYYGSFQRHIMHAPDYWRTELVEESRIERVSKAWHIDHQLGVAHERGDWPVYAPPWWIAGQEGGSSQISGRVNPRHWWHWWGYSRKLPFIWHPPGGRGSDEELVHYGWTRQEGSFLDAGVARIESRVTAENFAAVIGGEAVGMERLPGVECSPGVRDLLADAWPGGVVEGPATPELSSRCYERLRPGLALLPPTVRHGTTGPRRGAGPGQPEE